MHCVVQNNWPPHFTTHYSICKCTPRRYIITIVIPGCYSIQGSVELAPLVVVTNSRYPGVRHWRGRIRGQWRDTARYGEIRRENTLRISREGWSVIRCKQLPIQLPIQLPFNNIVLKQCCWMAHNIYHLGTILVAF